MPCGWDIIQKKSSAATLAPREKQRQILVQIMEKHHDTTAIWMMLHSAAACSKESGRFVQERQAFRKSVCSRGWKVLYSPDAACMDCGIMSYVNDPGYWIRNIGI